MNLISLSLKTRQSNKYHSFFFRVFLVYYFNSKIFINLKNPLNLIFILFYPSFYSIGNPWKILF
jgi:hypothetical protein